MQSIANNDNCEEIRPLTTLADVARLAGVSRRSAGQVLNGGQGNTRVSRENCRRVRKAAKSLGYRPNHAARILRGKRSHVLGLMVASAGDPLRSFLVQYLDAEADKVGCNAVIVNTYFSRKCGDREFSRRVEELQSRGADGILFAVHHWMPGDRRELLQRFPNTVFYEDPGIAGTAHVAADRSAAVQSAVNHLVEKGRRRIALGVMSKARPTHVDRCKGYEDGLIRHGLAFNEKLVFDASEFGTVAADVDEETRLWRFPENVIDALIESLVVDGRADAVIVHDDFWAAVLLKKLRARGFRVPGDVAVVGYLNHYLCDWTDPPLTTVDPCHQEAAKQMVALLERMIGGEKIDEDKLPVKIRPHLVIREST